jgi:hypothetical protein
MAGLISYPAIRIAHGSKQSLSNQSFTQNQTPSSRIHKATNARQKKHTHWHTAAAAEAVLARVWWGEERLCLRRPPVCRPHCIGHWNVETPYKFSKSKKNVIRLIDEKDGVLNNINLQNFFTYECNFMRNVMILINPWFVTTTIL